MALTGLVEPDDDDRLQIGISGPDDVTTAKSYDAADRLTGITHTGPGSTTLRHFTYTLDAAGNRTRWYDRMREQSHQLWTPEPPSAAHLPALRRSMLLATELLGSREPAVDGDADWDTGGLSLRWGRTADCECRELQLLLC